MLIDVSFWNYINKVWNASRFVLMNIEDLKELNFDNINEIDKWILTKYNKTLKNVIKHMDKYDFNIVGTELYNFVYNDFCSNYIEMSKYNIDSISTKSTLCYILTNLLKMLHPFMPFVTEEIYKELPIKENISIMISDYPKYNKKEIFEKEEEIVDDEIEFIKSFRNIKQENNMTKDLKVMFDTEDDNNLIVKMLKLDDNLINKPLGIKSYNVFSKRIKARIFFEKKEDEASKKLKEITIKALKSSIERRKKLLQNENYINKAPKNIVELDKQKLIEEKKKLEELLK